MNPNFAPENPSNVSSKDASLFAGLDARSFASTLRGGVRAIKKGADWTGEKFTEGADAIGDEMLNKKATKKQKRMVGLGVEGAGAAGLAWLVAKMLKNKSNSNSNASAPGSAPQESWISKLTKGVLLVGGVGVAGYALSKFSIADWIGNIPGAKTLEDAKKAAEDAKKLADETIGKLTETVKGLETRISELPNLIENANTDDAKKKLEEELASAKSAVKNAKTEILRHQQESSVAQTAVENIGQAMAGEAEKKNKEASIEQKIFGKTWEKTRAILVRNGLLAQNEADQLQSKESLIAWAKKEVLESEMGKAMENGLNETDAKKQIAITLGIVALLIMRKFKTAAGVGTIAFLGSYLMQDENKTAQDVENTKNATKELYELYSQTLIDQGYNDQETRTLFSDILGKEILRLFNFDTFITPESAEANKSQYSELQTEITNLKNIKENDLNTIQQEALQQVALIIKTQNEAKTKQKKQPIAGDLYYHFFLNLKILGITIKEVHSGSNGYNLHFNKPTIVISHLPYNPLPEKISEEEKQEKYSEKQYELLSKFEKNIAGFIEYQKEHTEIFQTGLFNSLYNQLKTINSLPDGVKFPQEAFDKLIPEIDKLKTVPGVKIQNTSTGTLFVSLPPHNARTLVGITAHFNKETTDPRSLSSADKSTLYEMGLKKSTELLGEMGEKRKDNMNALYKSLPNNSPLKKHFAKYLTGENHDILDPNALLDVKWWAEFFILLLNNPTDSLFAKIESGVFIVATPVGEFALFSLLDPAIVQVEALQALFGDDEMSFQEYIGRSFIGAGVVFGITGAIGGAVVGNGIAGKTTGAMTGFVRGLSKGITLNPLFQGGNQAYLALVRKHLGGTFFADKYKITASRLTDPNSYLPMWVHSLRGSSKEVLLQAYARNVQELALYKNTGLSTGLNTSKFSNLAFAEIARLEAKNAVIDEIFKKQFAIDGDDLKDFQKLAKELASPEFNGDYIKFLKQNFPKVFYEKQLFDAFKTASTAGINNIDSTFASILGRINTHVPPLGNLEKIQLETIIHQQKISAIIKQTNSSNLALSKTTLSATLSNLTALHTTLSSSPSTIPTETKVIKALITEIENHQKVITEALAKIDLGKVPKLPMKYLELSINPFSKFNITGLGRIDYGKHINTLGRWGIYADGGIAVVQSGLSIYNAQNENLSEGVRDSYYAKAGVQAITGVATVGTSVAASTGLGAVPAGIAYAVISGVEGVALGGVDAQMTANANHLDMANGEIWTKDALLKKVVFMNSTDLDTDVKNTFHDLRMIAVQASLTLTPEEKIAKKAEINADKGHTIKEIRETIWKAMAIIESHDSALTGKAQEYFREAYFEYISKNTNGFTASNKTTFSTEKMHLAAIEFAYSLAEDIEANEENGIATETFKQSIAKKVNPVVIPTFNEKAKEEVKIENIEVDKKHEAFDKTLIVLAKKLGYSGELNIASVQNLFFTKENKTKHGIYWDKSDDVWKIHRMETLIPDEAIPSGEKTDKYPNGLSDHQRIKYLLGFIGTHQNSIFTSEGYGTFENTIDSVYEAITDIGTKTGFYNLEKDKNREIIQNSAKEFSENVILSFLETRGYKEKIQSQNISVYDKGIIIFSLLNGYTGDITIEAIKKARSMESNSLVRWNAATNKWDSHITQTSVLALFNQSLNTASKYFQKRD